MKLELSDQSTLNTDSSSPTFKSKHAAISEFGYLALRRLDIQELMDKATTLIVEIFDTDYSKLLELCSDKKQFIFRSGVGWEPGVIGHTKISASENSIAGYTLHTTNPVIFENLKMEARFTSPQVMFKHGIVSGIYVVIPLTESVFGVLGTCSKSPRVFTSEDIHFLQAIANILGQAIARKQIEIDKLFLASIVESSKDSIVTIDFERTITSWNKSAEILYGYSAADAMGKKLEMLIFSEDIKKLLNNVDRIRYHQEVEIYDTIRIDKKGALLYLDIVLSPVKNANDEVIGVSTIARDTTARNLVGEALVLSEERYRTLVQQVEDYAIFGLDVEGKIISWNEGVEKILGYSEKDIIGESVAIIFTPEDREKGIPKKELQTAINNGQAIGERVHIRKDGTRFYATDLMSAIMDDKGVHTGYSKVMRDISQRKLDEDTIQHQSLHDTLTGLPNRKALEERLSFAINIAARKNQCLAVMFLDLDRFKNINDTLGHSIGDIILQEVASRFQSSIRKEDTAARLGGDEFIILLTEISTGEDAMIIADKILHSMIPPIHIGKHVLHMSTSIGIALYPFDGKDSDILLRNADTALYRAKESGRNQYKMYNQAMNVYASERLVLENELREALASDQFVLHFQPVVESKSKKTVGVEALLRWKHPRKGLVFPDEFIPIAEEISLIIPIGEWVLRQACKQIKLWHKMGMSHLRIAVNVSSRQFSESSFVDTIATILEQTELRAEFLELEITESIAMQNVDRTDVKLRELRKMGVILTIDDFGTGYSSLSYLKRFPLSNLKIDKLFVRHCIVNEQDSAIIRTIISMAHNLNIRVTAEGVETEQQLNFLTRLKCHYLQGYFISHPTAAAETTEWLKNNT